VRPNAFRRRRGPSGTGPASMRRPRSACCATTARPPARARRAPGGAVSARSGTRSWPRTCSTSAASKPTAARPSSMDTTSTCSAASAGCPWAAWTSGGTARARSSLRCWGTGTGALWAVSGAARASACPRPTLRRMRAACRSGSSRGAWSPPPIFPTPSSARTSRRRRARSRSTGRSWRALTRCCTSARAVRRRRYAATGLRRPPVRPVMRAGMARVDRKNFRGLPLTASL
jgi:hypothetical protein